MPNEIKEQLRKEIEDGRQRVAEKRIERGLEGVDPPHPFVEPSDTVALIDRCAGLERFAKQYLQIIDKANQVVGLSDKQAEYVRGFTNYAALIRMSEDRRLANYGFGAQLIIGLIGGGTESGQSVHGNTDKFVRSLYTAIEITSETKDSRTYKDTESSVLDDDLINDYIQQYDEIKHKL